jgi:hypothetical protein
MVTGTWNIGDIFEKDSSGDFGGNSPHFVKDNSSVIPLGLLNWASRVPVVVTGGQLGTNISNEAYGLSFVQVDLNGLKVLEGRVEQRFPDLPAPRFLHSTVAVKIKGHTHLLVLGGKSQIQDMQSLNTVIKLDIHDYISTDTKKQLSTDQ